MFAKLHQYDDALIYSKQALEIRKNASPDQSKDSNVAWTLHDIGVCLQNLHQYDKAMVYTKQAQETFKEAPF